MLLSVARTRTEYTEPICTTLGNSLRTKSVVGCVATVTVRVVWLWRALPSVSHSAWASKN